MVDITWVHRVYVNDVEVDRCKVGLPLQITHGRSSVSAQPDAPVCTFTWVGPTPPGAIGDLLMVTMDLTDTGPEWIYDAPNNYTYDNGVYVWDNAWNIGYVPRFRGNISGLEAHEVEGVVTSWSVSCVGLQAQWGAVALNITRPQESDVERVQAISAALGEPITVHGTSTLQLTAEVIADEALPVLQKICQSSAGLVWQATDGTMHYGTANHRQVPPEGVLTCHLIRDGLSWASQMDMIVNHVTVSYGTGGTSEVTVQDAASISRSWGMRHVDAATTLVTADDANALGALIIERRAYPYWQMPNVMAMPDPASRADQIVLAELEVSDIVLIPAETLPSPTPGALTAWVVEGWVEQRSASGTAIQIALSDAARWVNIRIRTWGDAAEVTWDYEKTGTWLDALTFREVAV